MSAGDPRAASRDRMGVNEAFFGVRVHPTVADAIAGAAPVVALETAVVTHGLPRESWTSLQSKLPMLGEAPAWIDRTLPLNLAAMRAMTAAVREGGAMPAVTAVVDGRACVGLEDQELVALASAPAAAKLSWRDLAPAMARRARGGTTVAATLALCSAAGVRVFATGGIGGVHRGWREHPDISADLHALARFAVCVVASGAKSILDLPATMEALATLSVPVVGLGCASLPRFVLESEHSLRLPASVDDAAGAAEVCKAHWSLGGAGVLVAHPVDPAEAVAPMEDEQTGADAAETGLGADATPRMLGRLVERTKGRSLRANVHLLRGNALAAAGIAIALARNARA